MGASPLLYTVRLYVPDYCTNQAALDANGEISKTDALALASVNLEKLLGIKTHSVQGNLIATSGGDLLEFSSKVVGVISPRRGVVDIM